MVLPEKKGIYLKLKDLNQWFKDTLTTPVILNEANTLSKGDDDYIQKKLLKPIKGDILESYPHCDCGNLNLEYYHNPQNPEYCPECNTPVVYQHEKDLEAVLWLHVPDGIPAFINPAVWYMLYENMHYFNKGGNYLRYVVDPRFQPPQNQKETHALIAANIPRGWNNFVNNFSQVIQTIFDIMVTVNKHNQEKVDNLRHFIFQENKETLFTKYLPIPNSLCFILESEDTYKRSSLSAQTLVRAVNHIQGVRQTEWGSSDEELPPLTKKELVRSQSALVKFTLAFNEFYDGLLKSEIGKKPGIIRKDLLGVRPPFSARMVITLIKGPHQADEVHIPWTVGVSLLKVELSSKLLRCGYNPMEIYQLLENHKRVYHPLIDKLFKEIISESKHKGLASFIIRNPSLYKLSNQQQFITKIKTDVHDRTMSTSALCLKGYNGDYDGDELGLFRIMDEDTYKDFEPLNIKHGVLSLGKVHGFGNAMSLPNSIVQMCGNFDKIYE